MFTSTSTHPHRTQSEIDHLFLEYLGLCHPQVSTSLHQEQDTSHRWIRIAITQNYRLYLLLYYSLNYPWDMFHHPCQTHSSNTHIHDVYLSLNDFEVLSFIISLFRVLKSTKKWCLFLKKIYYWLVLNPQLIAHLLLI